MTKSSLRDRLNQEVEGWRPEAGDEILGEVVTVDTREGDYGPYPYIEVEDEATGKIVGVHAFHTLLKNEISQKRPQVGDTLGVKYHGKRETKRTDSKGRTQEYESYRVVFERASGEPVAPAPDWSALEDDAKSEAAETGITEAQAADKVNDTFGTDEEPF